MIHEFRKKRQHPLILLDMLVGHFANLPVLHSPNSIVGDIDSWNDGAVIIVITNISGSGTLGRSGIKPSVSLLHVVLVQQNNVVVFAPLLWGHSLRVIHEVDGKAGKVLKSVFDGLDNLRKDVGRLDSNIYALVVLVDFDVFGADETLQELWAAHMDAVLGRNAGFIDEGVARSG